MEDTKAIGVGMGASLAQAAMRLLPNMEDRLSLAESLDRTRDRTWDLARLVPGLYRNSKSGPGRRSYLRSSRPSKYQTHQGARECARRRRQMAAASEKFGG